MKRRTKFLLAGTMALAAVGGSAAAVAASSGGDDDGSSHAITGADLEQASQVALAEVGSGRVTATEADDEEGAFEVEVTKPDGSQVDVHLDKTFHVINVQDDGPGEGQGEHGDQGESN
jgi:uncharacterized membrane protein YkoI